MTYIVLTANCLYLALVLYVFYIGRRWSKFITRMNKAMDDFESETTEMHEKLMAFLEEDSDGFDYANDFVAPLEQLGGFEENE